MVVVVENYYCYDHDVILTRDHHDILLVLADDGDVVLVVNNLLVEFQHLLAVNIRLVEDHRKFHLVAGILFLAHHLQSF